MRDLMSLRPPGGSKCKLRRTVDRVVAATHVGLWIALVHFLVSEFVDMSIFKCIIGGPGGFGSVLNGISVPVFVEVPCRHEAGIRKIAGCSEWWWSGSGGVAAASHGAVIARPTFHVCGPLQPAELWVGTTMRPWMCLHTERGHCRKKEMGASGGRFVKLAHGSRSCRHYHESAEHCMSARQRGI